MVIIYREICDIDDDDDDDDDCSIISTTITKTTSKKTRPEKFPTTFSSFPPPASASASVNTSTNSPFTILSNENSTGIISGIRSRLHTKEEGVAGEILMITDTLSDCDCDCSDNNNDDDDGDNGEKSKNVMDLIRNDQFTSVRSL